MISDLRLALRRFRFKPAHTVLTILILGIGIGATTAVFSVVDQTLLRPAPFAYADRLVDVLDIDRATGGGGNRLAPAKIVGWQTEAALFERFEAYAPRQFDVTGEVEPERVQGLLVSTGLFDMLGVHPRSGRSFVREDGAPGAERVVVISEALWRRKLAHAKTFSTHASRSMMNRIGSSASCRRFRLTGDKESLWLPRSPAEYLDANVRFRPGRWRRKPRGPNKVLADTIDQRQIQAPSRERDYDWIPRRSSTRRHEPPCSSYSGGRIRALITWPTPRVFPVTNRNDSVMAIRTGHRRRAQPADPGDADRKRALLVLRRGSGRAERNMGR
jgi:hypothetical protein